MSLKNNKYLRRLAAALVTGTMIVSMFGMTALAAPVTTDPDAKTGIKITKELDMTNAPRASVPAITYEYTITAGNAVDAQGTDPAILAGVGNIAPVEISFGPSTTITDNKAVAEGTIDFSQVVFNAPGIYRYKIDQTIKAASKVNGITEVGPTTLYLDLYVENANPDDPDGTSYKIAFAVMHNTTDAPSLVDGQYNYGATKTDGFKAKYQTYTLTLIKNLAGDAADLRDEFDFTINFAGGDTSETFKYIVTTDGQTATETTATLGTSFKVTLGDNDQVVISGIPSNITYTISETNDKGYTAKYTITKGTTPGTETTDDTITGEEMTAMDNSVTFTNTKAAVTPTGVILNIIPYVVMVVLAAGLAFLFLRRRKREF